MDLELIFVDWRNKKKFVELRCFIKVIFITTTTRNKFILESFAFYLITEKLSFRKRFKLYFNNFSCDLI